VRFIALLFIVMITNRYYSRFIGIIKCSDESFEFNTVIILLLMGDFEGCFIILSITSLRGTKQSHCKIARLF